MTREKKNVLRNHCRATTLSLAPARSPPRAPQAGESSKTALITTRPISMPPIKAQHLPSLVPARWGCYGLDIPNTPMDLSLAPVQPPVGRRHDSRMLPGFVDFVRGVPLSSPTPSVSRRNSQPPVAGRRRNKAVTRERSSSSPFVSTHAYLGTGVFTISTIRY